MHQAAKLSPLPLGERDEQLRRWIESHEDSIGVGSGSISIETLPADDWGNQRPLNPEDKCPHGIYSPLYCSGCSTVSLEPPDWFRSEPPYERKQISSNGTRYRKDEYVGGYAAKGKRYTLQVEDGVVELNNSFGGSGIQWVQISHREVTNCLPQGRVLGPQRDGGRDWWYGEEDFQDAELYRFGHSRSIPGVKPLTTDPVRFVFVGNSCFVPTVKFEDSLAFRLARFRNQPWERWSVKVYLDVRWIRDYFTEWSLEATRIVSECRLFPVFRHAEHSGKNACGFACRKESVVDWRDSRKAKSMRAAARLKVKDAAKLWGVSDRTARRRLAEMRKVPYAAVCSDSQGL